MSVIALQVSARRGHPNADALYVYDFAAPERSIIQVIGNRDIVYQPGDVVAVALAGATLKDGTPIRTVSLRGVESSGMALEPVDAAPGSDLSQEYCLSEAEVSALQATPAVIKWTSVELLHNVRKGLDVQRSYAGDGYAYPKVTYRAKVKLDGTNGGVQILPSGQVVPQSRSRVLDVKDDNIGFAAWVTENRSYFESIESGGEHIIVFGEWCGRGIQKRTSISGIDRRVFAVFAVQYGNHHTLGSTLLVEPDAIRALLPDHPDVFVLPWHGAPVTIDFGDRPSLERAVSAINGVVADVEACDPWVAATFGVDGLGEGVVLYPEVAPVDGDPRVLRDSYTGLMFKAKGEKHQVVKQKKPAQIDPEVAASVAHFVEMFVTTQRLEQGVAEACGGTYAMKQMGNFMKWLGQDVKKESAAELEASGLAWKDVSRSVMNAGRAWYKQQATAL